MEEINAANKQFEQVYISSGGAGVAAFFINSFGYLKNESANTILRYSHAYIKSKNLINSPIVGATSRKLAFSDTDVAEIRRLRK
jgi:hypothetical protein